MIRRAFLLVTGLANVLLLVGAFGFPYAFAYTLAAAPWAIIWLYSCVALIPVAASFWLYLMFARWPGET